jgi:hypothetical protein
MVATLPCVGYQVSGMSDVWLMGDENDACVFDWGMVSYDIMWDVGDHHDQQCGW